MKMGRRSSIYALTRRTTTRSRARGTVDAEPDELCTDVERSTSDDAVVASFAWRISSVPDIDDGRRLVMGGDLTPGRPSVEELDVTRA
jgi:hypothetical protein